MKTKFTLIILSLILFQAKSQPVFTCLDIDKLGYSIPDKFISYNGILYFTADDGVNGEELWVTDGTPGGTRMLLDIHTTYKKGSAPNNFIQYNGKLFFTADDGVCGKELWVTDGTVSGTMLFKDIDDRVFSSNPREFKICNGKLYFSANDGHKGDELWVTDGTGTGTKLVVDLNSGSNPAKIGNLTVFKNKLFFSADIGSKVLCYSDGTDTGTRILKDKNGLNIDGGHFTECNGKLFFIAYDPVKGVELWATDGTSSNTGMVKDINVSGSAISYASEENMLNYNGLLIFTANDGIKGEELWTSDGTLNGTQLLKDINPSQYYLGPRNFKIFNGKLHFTANNGTNGIEPWISDGTPSGTFMLKDVTSPVYDIYNDFRYIEYKGKLYFTATDGYTWQLFSTDGTTNGTQVMMPDMGCEPYTDFYIFNNTLYFSADNIDNRNIELWRSDGIPSGTYLLKEINVSVGSEPSNFIVFKDKLFFQAQSSIFGQELWATNGSESNTMMIKDINPAGFASSSPSEMIEYNGHLVFAAYDDVHGNELWTSDGTENGTNLILDIETISNISSNPKDFTVLNGKLYFSAQKDYERELWVTDGTASGTKMLKNIHLTGSSNPANFITLNNKMYFTAQNGTITTNLWVTDGTTSGTQILKVLFPNIGTSPFNFTTYKGKLYFSVNDYTTAITTLWQSDGTASGTAIFKTLSTYKSTDKYDNPFIEFNGNLYFAANDNINGTELWTSDGTLPGTKMVKNIVKGLGGSFPGNFVIYKNKLIFSVTDSLGRELWITDGTEIGTVNLADIHSGKSSSYPNRLVVYNNLLYFLAIDSIYNELFVSDGTKNGTYKITPDFADKRIESLNMRYDKFSRFIEYNNSLYFCANFNEMGAELWKMRDSSLPSRINQEQAIKGIIVYPNPNMGAFNIQSPDRNSMKAGVCIVDITGKVIYQGNVKNNEGIISIDLKDICPGIYFMTLKGEIESYYAKFIVE